MTLLRVVLLRVGCISRGFYPPKFDTVGYYGHWRVLIFLFFFVLVGKTILESIEDENSIDPSNNWGRCT